MRFPLPFAALTFAAAFPASAQLPLIGGSYVQSVRLVVTAGFLLPTGASLGQVICLGAIRGFDPQPDPPGCRAILAFADAQGNPAGPHQGY